MYNNTEPRKMFSGNWTCSKCGASINELPFEPDPARISSLVCRDCLKSSRDERPARTQSDRPMVKGDWVCSKCGAAITELPFEPDPERVDTLMCRDCHAKNRPPRRDFGGRDGGSRGGNGGGGFRRF